MPSEHRINLLDEPTVEDRYRIAAQAERAAVAQMMFAGADTATVTAAEARAQLFEALAEERAEQRLAGALPTRPPSTIVPTLDSRDL